MSQGSKKVLIVTHHYPPHITGVGMVAHSQAKRLVSLGHDVTVVSSQTSDKEKSSVMNGVKVICIKALNFCEDKFNAPFPIFSPRILSVLMKNVKNSDIVHVHDAFYMSSFLAAVFCRLYGKPMVLTQHVAMIEHPSGFIMFVQKVVYATTGKFIFNTSKKIFIFNDRIKNFLISQGVQESKFEILLNGVDTELFYPASSDEKIALKNKFGLSQNKKIILFVGRLVPKKGFDKLLASRSDKYQIVFAGCDRLEPDTEQVKFLGKMSNADLAQVYRAADIFALPSESEGFPLSIQEAMACGVPILSTNDEGYKSYGFDLNLIRLLDQSNKESVKAALDLLVSDDDLLNRMSIYSREYAVLNFSWTNLIKKLVATYDRVSP